jgi:hypothetical protein
MRVGNKLTKENHSPGRKYVADRAKTKRTLSSTPDIRDGDRDSKYMTRYTTALDRAHFTDV